MTRRGGAAAIVGLAAVLSTGAAAADATPPESPNTPAMAAPANTADMMQPLLLEVFVNGHDTGKIGEFVQRNGALLGKPAELEDLGLRAAKQAGNPDEPVPLMTIPGLKYRIDASAQTLLITAPNEALLPALLAAGAGSAAQVPVESGLGATLNYDLVATRSGSQNALNGLFDLRGFSPWGVASSGLLLTPDPSAANSNKYQAVRLDSNWTLSRPDTLMRYGAGDFISGGLGWSRPVRLGGLQVAEDFSLRPDLITFPLPALSGTAAVPSTVDVLVNGTRVLSTQAQPGPFVIPQLPVVSGASSVSLSVTDALGRQVITTLPFYTGGGLLASGLQSFSLETGLVRLGYGTLSNDYGSAAASGTWRRGLSDDITAEAHAEVTKDLVMGGGGGVLNLDNLALLNFGIAGSSGSGHSGILLQGGIARMAQPFSINLNATWAQAGFRDIASENFDAVPTLQLNAGAAWTFGTFGSVSLSYNHIDRPAAPMAAGSLLPQAAERARLLSGSYSVQFGSVSFYANAFRDLLSGSTGFILGLTVPLGARSSVTASGVSDSGHLYGELESSQSASDIGEFGYHVYAAEGSQSHEFGEARYVSPWAQVVAGVDVNRGQTALRVEAQGALSAIDGTVFPSPPVNDAFAVVDTNGLAGVRVLRENRTVGQTDSGGRIFIPDLHAFQVNHLSLDPNDIPPDIALSSATQQVRPQDRTGVVVPFQIRRNHSALLRLVDESQQPIAVGSAATLRSTGVVVPVGYDGEAYVEDLAEHDGVSVQEPDGKRCTAVFDYQGMPGEIPVIGPIACREGRP